MGVNKENETNQQRLMKLENGQCLIRDLYGRVGVVKFEAVFEELFRALPRALQNERMMLMGPPKLKKLSLGILTVLIVGISVLPPATDTAVYAAGLIDDPGDFENSYSEYPLDNYQLDFYIDTGIAKDKMETANYSITKAIWFLSRTVSNGAGYLVGEAYVLISYWRR